MAASDKVKVFPSSLRSGVNAESKFTSEKNITGILRSITDRDSFIINDNPWEFVIHGYYFQVTDTISGANQYAHILVDDYGERLVNTSDHSTTLDSGSAFTGLLIDSNASETAVASHTWYTLQLTDANGNLVQDNVVKFDSSSILFDGDSEGNSLNDKLFTIINSLEGITSNMDSAGNWDATHISGVLPVLNGGTGENSLDNLYVKGATQLVNNVSSHSPLSVGNGTNIIKIASGVPTVSTLTVGGYTAPVYLKNGVITKALTVNYSTATPGSASGSNGDLWFRYKG